MYLSYDVQSIFIIQSLLCSHFEIQLSVRNDIWPLLLSTCGSILIGGSIYSGAVECHVPRRDKVKAATLTHVLKYNMFSEYSPVALFTHMD